MRVGGWREATVVSVSMFVVGQLFLLAVAPLTRANGTFVESSGIALLAPDSRGYLRTAESIDGVLSWAWMRRAYPSILLVGNRLGDAPSFAVALHALAVVLAGAILYRMLRPLTSVSAAVLGVGILAANPMTAQWVRIVMTESIFYAAIVVLVALGHRALTQGLSKASWLGYLSVSALALFMRPNGVFVFASALTLLTISTTVGWARRAAVALIWLTFALSLPAFNASVGSPSEGTLTSQLYDGVVVEGTAHVRVVIQMPIPTDSTDESLTAAARYAALHPVATTRLGLTRVAYETLQVRRHYPLIVNLGFGAAILTFLVISILGWSSPKSREMRTVALIFSSPLLLLTAATFAVPESRYGWAYLLPLVPVAAVGFDRLTSRLRADTSHGGTRNTPVEP